MRNAVARVVLLVAVSGVLSACVSLTPSYERPASPVPESWPTGQAYAPPAVATLGVQDASARSVAALPWKAFFKDTNLQQVIDQALVNSRDLRSALARIQSARAQYRIQRANLLPKVSGDLSGSKSKSVAPLSGGGNNPIEAETYSLTAGLSAFEIDLFGKQRSLSKAALEAFLSTEEAARATQISLIAETASAYLEYASNNSQLAISKRTLESARHSMELTQKRLEAGVASRVDVRQAETVYQTARADVATLTAAIAQARNALELLVGARVDDSLLPSELPAESRWLADVPAGMSSSVLLNRPDVRGAEHNLKAANANIGAARAAFFPSLSLTASGGLASTSLSNLVSGGGRASGLLRRR